MSAYTFALLPDHVVTQRLDSHAITHRKDFALFLAEIAEFDARRLWAPAGYHSTADYCETKHRLDHDLACRWIGVARVGHRYPVIFPALADGRLSQTTVLMLKPYHISHTAPALIDAAMGRSKREVERLLAEKFPRPDLPTEIRPLTVSPILSAPLLCSPATAAPPEALSINLVAPAQVVSPVAPAPMFPMMPPAPRARVAPLSPGRNALQVTVDDETVELLQQAKDLLSHVMPNADAGTVLKRALQCLVRELERRKFASVPHPRAAKGRTDGPRVPASVRRDVHQRDGDACGFIGPDGHRCGSRDQLEWDHKEPVAMGGKSTTANVRQLCRAHNQYEAERRFGAGFMERKRAEARAR